MSGPKTLDKERSVIKAQEEQSPIMSSKSIYLRGTESLPSSIKERSCICDINISTSSTFELVVASRTSPSFMACSRLPPSSVVLSAFLKHAKKK